MNVLDLITALQAYPLHLPVMLTGYEGGITETILVRRVSVKRDVHTEDYYGEHEEDVHALTSHDEAVLLSRK